MLIKNKSIAIFLFGASVALGSCWGQKLENIPANADPSAEIKKLDQQCQEAVKNQVDVLSPTNFKDASAALKNAEESRDNGRDNEKTLRYVAEGRAYLKKASHTADVAHPVLGEVIATREDAIKASAPKFVKSEFEAADQKLMAVTKDIEDDSLKAAKEGSHNLQKLYADIEIKAIKIASVGEAKDKIDDAIKEGAKSLAPQTLAQAQKSLKEVDNVITKNPHDKAAINEASVKAANDADHLLDVTRQAKVAGKTDAETLVLQREATESLAAKERAKAGQSEANLANQKNVNANLQGQKADLESEKAFNEKFKAAQAQFNPAEAEVSRVGDSLVIRLKGLAFKTGDSQIPSSDFSVLNKVQKVIQSFGDNKVVIEGHTDSTGGKAVNAELSAKRAAAVESYLVAQGVVDADRVSSQGYGDEKPIASNKTKIGRAQNRRVDVIIDAKAH